jgi:hypothetical protein
METVLMIAVPDIRHALTGQFVPHTLEARESFALEDPRGSGMCRGGMHSLMDERSSHALHAEQPLEDRAAGAAHDHEVAGDDPDEQQRRGS